MNDNPAVYSAYTNSISSGDYSNSFPLTHSNQSISTTTTTERLNNNNSDFFCPNTDYINTLNNSTSVYSDYYNYNLTDYNQQQPIFFHGRFFHGDELQQQTNGYTTTIQTSSSINGGGPMMNPNNSFISISDEAFSSSRPSSDSYEEAEDSDQQLNRHNLPKLSGETVDEDPLPGGYKCKVCHYICYSKEDLSQHNASEHSVDVRQNTCDQCGRAFVTTAHLTQHLRIHQGVKPFPCKYCDRRFTQLCHVQQHERIHTGEKPYTCQFCPKSFTQMSNLQSHQRQHLKDKTIKCDHCMLCFETQAELATHVEARHSGHKYSKIIMCPICSKSYFSLSYLKKHLQRHKEKAFKDYPA